MGRIRENLRAVVDAARAVTGPLGPAGGLGLRSNTLTIRTRTWADGRPGSPGAAVHLYPPQSLTTTSSSPPAISLPTAIVLLNELRLDYAVHLLDTMQHQVQDSLDVSTPPASSDLPTAITLANALRAAYGLHVANATVHWNVDVVHVISAPVATDLPSVQTLANALQSAFNAHILADAVADVDLVLPQQYRIRQLATNEIVQSGGRYEMGDVIMEHITPWDGISVGFTVAQLKPPAKSNSVQIIYIVTSDDVAGGHTGEYELRELRSWRPFSFDLVLKRRETTP